MTPIERPGPGSRARSRRAGRRSTRGRRPRRRRARRRGAPRTSRRGPAAGPCPRAPGVGSVDVRGPARLGDGPRRGDARLQLLRPVEPQGDRSGPARGTRPAHRRGSGTGRSRGPSAGAGPGPASRTRPGCRRGGRARAPRGAASATSPRSSRTIGRTSKMNDFVASSVCWTIATSWRTSPAPCRIALDEALDDLGLEHDVRQALGRPVVHRPGDLAAEVLLGIEDQPRDGGRHRGVVVRPPAPRHRRAGRIRRISAGSRPPIGREVLGDRVAVAGQGAALALEDVDLGLHQGGALGQRDQARRLVEALLGVAVRAGSGVELVGGRGAGRSWRVASALAWVDEQVDLAQLAVELDEVVHESARTARRAVAAVAVGQPGRSSIGHQSSGIRIQPWRIAYTTAWVRSLTDSLRRIELMWFLTVCSLIDSA